MFSDKGKTSTGNGLKTKLETFLDSPPAQLALLLLLLNKWLPFPAKRTS
jgi:hypothetical protein